MINSLPYHFAIKNWCSDVEQAYMVSHREDTLISSSSSFLPGQYCLTDKPEVRPLDPFKTGLQKYLITEMQPVYFLAESVQDAKEKVK